MGDAILFGVLRMPPELWRDDDFDKRQRHARYVQAADEIEALRAECERLRAELEPAYAEFEVVADDDDAEVQCAYTTGPREDALREAMHYAAVYSKDGPVKVREVIRRDIAMEASNDR